MKRVPPPPFHVKHRSAHQAYLERLYAARISLTAIPRAEAWERHIEESLSAAPLLGGAVTLVDVGSGGGTPGVPLAIELPLEVTLVESAARKADFLRATTAALGLHVAVWAERSEEAARGAGRDRFDAAVARALAPPPAALELVLPFVRPGGIAILWTGRVEVPPLDGIARHLGAELECMVDVAPGRNLAVVRKVSQTPERFPRRPGMARKRPLAPLRSPA